MPQLIINADDFGFTDGVTRGIVKAIREGVVTSTTAMVCVPGACARLETWSPVLPSRIGAHLQLTTGHALTDPSQIPTLCGPDGKFPASKKALQNASTAEIIVEWEEQFRRLRFIGIEPTHIDTHHHVHQYPHVLEAFCEIARRFHVPARALTRSMGERLRSAGIRCADRFILDFYGDNMTAERLLELLDQAVESGDTPSVIEMMCHPGIACSDLADQSKYVHQRFLELKALRSPGLRKQLEARGFELIAYPRLVSS